MRFKNKLRKFNKFKRRRRALNLGLDTMIKARIKLVIRRNNPVSSLLELLDVNLQN